MKFFNRKASWNKEAVFWDWFIANEPRLFAFEADREEIFDELGEQMKRVNEELTFEFSPIKNGKRQFVISAGGIKSAFPAVEALYGKAPKLERWEWVKFRPRRYPLNDVQFGHKSVKVEDVRYLLAADGDKAGIVLFFEGYQEREKGIFGQIGFLLLDEALGEYAVEAHVGFVEFHSNESEYFAQSHPLRDLQAHFDEFLGRRVH